MDYIEDLLGTRPIIGGQHPEWGTRNALLSLGNTYLEVLAPDEPSAIPENERWMSQYFNKSPQLSTWALHCKSIEKVREYALKNDIQVGKLMSGQRKRSNGEWLRWLISDPYTLPFDGALPFLISWIDSTHPSETTSQAGELIILTLEHPKAHEIEAQLKLLGISLRVIQADQFKISATIRISRGVVVLF